MTVEQSVAVLTEQVKRLTDQGDRMDVLIGQMREQSAGGPFVQQSVYVLQVQSITDSLTRVGNHLNQLDQITYDNRDRKLAVADFDAYKAAQSTKFRWLVTTAITALGASGWAFGTLLGHG